MPDNMKQAVSKARRALTCVLDVKDKNSRDFLETELRCMFLAGVSHQIAQDLKSPRTTRKKR